MRFLLLGIVVILLDQVSKFVVLDFITGTDSLYVMHFLNISPVWNYGVSFGMFNDYTTNQSIFLGLSAFVVSFMLYAYKAGLVSGYCMLMVGGAISNCIDRVIHGAVFDFIDLHAFGYHYPTFNVADSMIVVGAILLSTQNFFIRKNESGTR
ncbi:Lipoprotein signal peptidase [Candidatus Cyrtobacter comes]|uniref:Lipoprotein signal peptidase n=1 Tax=Candidatus Cyrtobacter comes TaxID=675776 RepID=A0ABU5L7G2_9RICK|nr:signal peptidase II [Candidatus Cyrtobacter comes]MDZ5762058.1 Lipoprotein signal peptidase [Candidatus Cyrtobacter comes]